MHSLLDTPLSRFLLHAPLRLVLLTQGSFQYPGKKTYMSFWMTVVFLSHSSHNLVFRIVDTEAGPRKELLPWGPSPHQNTSLSHEEMAQGMNSPLSHQLSLIRKNHHPLLLGIFRYLYSYIRATVITKASFPTSEVSITVTNFEGHSGNRNFYFTNCSQA